MTSSILPVLSNPESGTPYVAYSYSYPHKTAYRAIDPPIGLGDVWSREKTDALFLYIHVPFCEHRCGFCNLFTQANPEQGLTTRYLNQLRAEAQEVSAAIAVSSGEVSFARLAIGGGTPTFLDPGELETLFQITETMNTTASQIPVSIEVSPATVDTEKLKLLQAFGADRISIGIQSFNDDEAHRLGRPQKKEEVIAALDGIRDHGFPILNLDLIYGGEGQSTQQWMASIAEALRWQPEELYLYPLYVRPLTGLGRLDREWDDQRLEAYREARDFLLGNGYCQVSMRMFKRTDSKTVDGPIYCCQSDGMVGLGCGARSYTSELHYSTEFAVGRKGVASILGDYIKRNRTDFSTAQHGFRLSADDQQRRYVIQSLLQIDGLNCREYSDRFGSDVRQDLRCLEQLIQSQLAESKDDTILLTPAGVERSDAIGPWLYSANVRSLMNEFELN